MKLLGVEARTFLLWLGLAAAILLPISIAVLNPLQQGRDTLWTAGGLAGVVALAFLLLQPLLAAGYLPGPSMATSRRWHRWTGAVIAAAILLHVGWLYLSSPDDVLDVLLLVSPTPFSVYGAIGLVGVIITVFVVALRRRMGLRYTLWRIIHNALALVVVIASIAHAMLIEGAMGTISKAMLCAIIAVATVLVLYRTHAKRGLATGSPTAGNQNS